MSDSTDPVFEIVQSGREVIPDDVELLWSELIDGLRSSAETMARGQSLLASANATHVANWGLSSMYHLLYAGTGDAAAHRLAREAWRHDVSEYNADPEGWERTYYQRMLIDFAEEHGTDRARLFGEKLIRSGVSSRRTASVRLWRPSHTRGFIWRTCRGG
jgi:hypothetical protein